MEIIMGSNSSVKLKKIKISFDCGEDMKLAIFPRCKVKKIITIRGKVRIEENYDYFNSYRITVNRDRWPKVDRLIKKFEDDCPWVKKQDTRESWASDLKTSIKEKINLYEINVSQLQILKAK